MTCALWRIVRGKRIKLNEGNVDGWFIYESNLFRFIKTDIDFSTWIEMCINISKIHIKDKQKHHLLKILTTELRKSSCHLKLKTIRMTVIIRAMSRFCIITALLRNTATYDTLVHKYLNWIDSKNQSYKYPNKFGKTIIRVSHTINKTFNTPLF